MTRLVIDSERTVWLIEDDGTVVDAVRIEADGALTRIQVPLPDGKTVEQETHGQAAVVFLLLFLVAFVVAAGAGLVLLHLMFP